MRRPRDVVHYTFEGGEADPQYERRADADLWSITAKRMRNVRLTNGGGFARRPGLARVLQATGTGRLWPFVSRAGSQRMLLFRNGATDVITTGETIAASPTSSSITSAYLQTMQIAQFDDKLIIASRGFHPQVLEWTEATTSFANAANYAFLTRSDDSKGWPYYRFRETRGVTLTPSARTGTGVTLTASAAVFNASHVGVRFTLLGREVEVTGYTSPTVVTVTVKQELYPTRLVTVGSTSGFSAGQIVQDSVGDIEMEVASIVSGTQLNVILMDTFTDPTTTDNQLLGPNGATALTAVGAASADGATVQWKEQLISAYRGYPGGVCVHKDRLIFSDFPAAPELHSMSVIGFYDDHDVGTGLDDEAIIDGPGDAKGRRVRWCVSAEQLVSLTEVGSYYVGEGPNTPLTPSNVEWLRIGPEPAGECNPIITAEGVIFREGSADRLMVLTPTGQLRRAWGATELASVASEIFISPTRLLLVDGCDLGPERYIFAVNSDGTLCVIHYRRDSEMTGATLWTAADSATFVDVCLFNNKVYAIISHGADFWLERFDNDRLLDHSKTFTNTAPSTPTNANYISKNDVALVWRKTAGGEARRADLGELYDTNGSGVFTGAPTATRDYEAGWRFTPEVVPWPPIDPMTGPSEHQRIARASIDVLRSGSFYAMDQLFSPYRAVDDITEPPPLRTGWRERKYLGRKRDFDFSVTQEEAAPLTVRSIVLKVS